MVPLSSAARSRLQVMFRPSDRDAAEEILVEQCGDNLAVFREYADPVGLERLRFAALKLSEGRIDKLRAAIQLAKVDWRDLLMASGFGEDEHEHLRWMPKEEGVSDQK